MSSSFLRPLLSSTLHGLALALCVVVMHPPTALASVAPLTGEALGELADVFDDAAADLMAEFRIPNASLAVMTGDGRLVLARGYTNEDAFMDGFDTFEAQPTSQYRIASISKTLTGVMSTKLVYEGAMALGDGMLDILGEPTLPGGAVIHPYLDDVTLEHLLVHCGGWDRSLADLNASLGYTDELAFDPMSADAQIAAVLGTTLPLTKGDIISFASMSEFEHEAGHITDMMPIQPPSTVMGCDMAYSNYGYMVLGEILEEVSGEAYEALVTRRVLQPAFALKTALASPYQEDRLAGEVEYMPTSSGSDAGCDTYERESVMYSEVDGDDTLANRPCTVQTYGGRRNLENQAAHGGWVSTPVDLMLYAKALFVDSDAPVLSQAEVSDMLDTRGTRYGLGWSLDFRGVRGAVGHTGSFEGTRAALFCTDPTSGAFATSGYCLAMLVNASPNDDDQDTFDDGDAIKVFVEEMISELDNVSDWGGTDDLFGDYVSANADPAITDVRLTGPYDTDCASTKGFAGTWSDAVCYRTLTYEVEVTNAHASGYAPAMDLAFTYTDMWRVKAGSSTETEALPRLAPGASTTVTFSVDVPLDEDGAADGLTTLSWDLDTDSAPILADTDEGNNSVEIAITEAYFAPDYAITDAILDDDAGDELVLTVRNQGPEAAEVEAVVTVMVDGELYAEAALAALEVAEEVEVRTGLAVGLIARGDQVTIEVEVDGDDDIDEYDETNNTYVLVLPALEPISSYVTEAYETPTDLSDVEADSAAWFIGHDAFDIEDVTTLPEWFVGASNGPFMPGAGDDFAFQEAWTEQWVFEVSEVVAGALTGGAVAFTNGTVADAVEVSHSLVAGAIIGACLQSTATLQDGFAVRGL